ncbi:hypothetical protein [Prescottella agglutinans]|uniref:Uncharacterized protein n=1 Tax=Prescottella agglutinans TaxID=1644129 RepID=A0ABT6M5I0_9NOCA|nr:hypothetical protein [Prescottella agglutinans]MDH6279548.1 hypothetical protein [Prescottella agglutinans]
MATQTATLLAEDIGGYAGGANLYQLDPPLVTAGLSHSHVVVWVQHWGQPEAVMVSASPSGAARAMVRLPGSYVHPEPTHSGALWLAGYEVVTAPEEPIDPPEEP